MTIKLVSKLGQYSPYIMIIGTIITLIQVAIIGKTNSIGVIIQIILPAIIGAVIIFTCGFKDPEEQIGFPKEIL